MRDGRTLRRIAARWQGVALTLVIGATTLWLAATGRLILYIHPRYVVFTVVLTVIGMAVALVSLAVGGRDDDEGGHGGEAANGDEHGHGDEGGHGGDEAGHGYEHDSGQDPTPHVGRAAPVRRVLGTATVAVTVTIAVGLVILPPATLSSATASTRDVGASTLSIGSGAVGATSSDAATSTLTVLDWAERLRQSTSLGDYAGKAVDVTGFIAPSTSDPGDTFVVTRFVITCCAVDAQPVGITVYDPSWRQSLKVDDWVTVRGGFGANPAGGQQPIAVVPTSVSKVAQPHDPYLY